MKCRSQRGLVGQSRAATTCSGDALREPLRAGRPPVTDLVPVPVPLQVENSERSRMACRIATPSGDPTAFPHGIDGSGATPPGRVACACTCRPSPMPIEASRRGGVAPIHSRKLRIGIAAPAAVVQPQGGRRHTEALSRTGNRGFRAQCTPLFDVRARIGIDPRHYRSRSAFREPPLAHPVRYNATQGTPARL